MKRPLILWSALLLLAFAPREFKEDQKRYSRVRAAYAEKEDLVTKLLTDNAIQIENLEIYLRAFKHEKELELWAKNRADKTFKLIKTYNICRTSGHLGPKRREGDRQIPEGFYHIEAFNPASSYHLSMRINYPNKSDKILGYQAQLGNNICIHGNCVTIGCLPITDDKIKELYLFCIEAKDKGQSTIPVSIYPMRLTDTNFDTLTKKHATHSEKVKLWTDLKVAYDAFKETKALPTISFLPNGRHKIN